MVGKKDYGTISNLYARSDMTVNSATVTAEVNTTVTGADITSTEAFYTTGSNWNTAAWDFTDIWEWSEDEGHSVLK